MYRGVAVAADGFEVIHAPGIIFEIGIGKAALEGAHTVVDLCRRSDEPFLDALLAEATIALKHGLTDRTPAAVVVDKLVAAVVVVAGLLGLGFGSKYSRHWLILS